MQLTEALDHLAAASEAMLEETMRWSAINSGSYHIDGLNAMRTHLIQAFRPLADGMEVRVLPPLTQVSNQGEVTQIPLGEALIFRKRPECPRRIILAGHYDTVFGKDHPFQAPRVEGRHLIGPGVADLKGGLVLLKHVLTWFEQLPMAETMGWDVVINPDEEIGSPGSDALFKELASRYQAGLIFEPARADGHMAATRKGSGNFTFVARGKAVHAGRDFADGRNAVVLLAEAIGRIAALTDARPGLTVNPAVIGGGRANNIVPDMAFCRFNVRLAQAEDALFITEALGEIARDIGTREGFALELHGGISRPPKPVNSDRDPLFKLVTDAANVQGAPLVWEASGGVCDGNNLAAYGVPNVDTMGVRGANLHSAQEYMVIESQAERAQMALRVLAQLAEGALETIKPKVN